MVELVEEVDYQQQIEEEDMKSNLDIPERDTRIQTEVSYFNTSIIFYYIIMILFY